MRYSIIVAFILILGNLSFAQRDNWQVTLTTGQSISEVALEDLSGDSLAVIQTGKTQWIPVQSIIEIRLVRKSGFWQGAKIGAIVGAIGGVIFLKPRHGSSSLPRLNRTVLKMLVAPFVGLYFGIIGGVFGAISGIDEVHDLSQMNLTGKLNTMQWLISREKAFSLMGAE